MEQESFRNKYREVKLRKYVPLLEKQVGIEIDKINDWRETCLEIKESLDYSKKEVNKIIMLSVGLLIIDLLILSFKFVRLSWNSKLIRDC